MSPISIGQFSELQNIPLSLMEPVLHERDSTIKFFLNGSRGQKFSEHNVTRRHFYCTFITRFPQENNSIYVDLMWRCPKTETFVVALSPMHTYMYTQVVTFLSYLYLPFKQKTRNTTVTFIIISFIDFKKQSLALFKNNLEYWYMYKLKTCHMKFLMNSTWC